MGFVLSRAAGRVTLALLLCGAGPAMAGCDGVIDDPTASKDGPWADGAGGPGAGGVTAQRLEARVWRLSPSQYEGEVDRLLGPDAPSVSLPDGAAEHGITNIAGTARVDLGNVSAFADAARTLGSWAAEQGAAVSRCDSHGSEECAASFLEWFPEAAFRRPVTEAERGELRALFDELEASYGFDYAFSGVVRAVLLSPAFLYRTELGPEGAEGDVVRLTSYEIASLLSFAITNRSPDSELMAAAERDELLDPDAREREARRLMAESGPLWERFFWEWLAMSTLDSQSQEVGLDPMLRDQMEEEFETFVRQVVVESGGGLRELLSAPYTWTRPELAAHYGADHPGEGLARIELNPDERGGLLTQGAWLVSHGKRGRANVVRRGMNVFIHAMCNNVAAPPDLDLEAELARLVPPDASVREVVEARGNDPTCGTCHRVADPVGLVFESYASDGSWQTEYADGRPVDTRVDVDGLGQFERAPRFTAALADDPRFQQCFVRRLTHFIVGAEAGRPSSADWTGEALERFVESDLSLEELLVAIVRHPGFVERTEGEDR